MRRKLEWCKWEFLEWTTLEHTIPALSDDLLRHVIKFTLIQNKSASTHSGPYFNVCFYLNHESNYVSIENQLILITEICILALRLD